MSFANMKEIFLRWQRLIIQFYFDGFRAMTVGRTLWKVILIKIFILFAILKMFFFPDYLRTHFSTDQQRSEHVLEQMTGQSVMRTGGNNK